MIPPTIFLLVTLGNLWIWKIAGYNFLLGLATFFASFVLFQLFNRADPTRLKMLGCLSLILAIAQWQTSDRYPLDYLNNEGKRIQNQRIGQYPHGLNVGQWQISLPLGHWFEGRRESIAFFTAQQNLAAVIDPNLYFFGNHPRQRTNVLEFEKFPFVSFPFFVMGLVSWLKLPRFITASPKPRTFSAGMKAKLGYILPRSISGEADINLELRKPRSASWRISPRKFIIFWALVAPIVTLTIVGQFNPLGPFSLFPLIAATTGKGLLSFWQWLENKNFLSVKIVSVFLIVWFMALMQLAAYDLF